MRSRRDVYEFVPICRQDAGSRHGRGVGLSIVATVVALLCIFAITKRGQETPRGTIAIVAGESKTRRLQDGSTVSLGPGTALRVEFTSERRDVHLLHGKALFDVVMESKRPFIVNTPVVEIAVAARSKFAVEIDTSVEVAVTEGVVKISGLGPAAGSAVIRLEGGDRYRVPVDRVAAIVTEGNDSSTPALTEG
jgi:ferric-dicitrate binding protein FerR (iron transport regulator)